MAMALGSPARAASALYLFCTNQTLPSPSHRLLTCCLCVGMQAAQLTLQHAAQLLHPASAMDHHSCNSANGCITPPVFPANIQQHVQQLAQQQTCQHSTQQSGRDFATGTLMLLQHMQLWPAQQLHHQQQQQYCQWRHYHPATHAARTLTQKLMQQRTWQASAHFRLAALPCSVLPADILSSQAGYTLHS